jgi:ATP-dependent RNA helicase DDX5/DBP2
LCLQEKLVANKDVTQLVALLASDEDRLPALMDYLHEHLHGAERASSSDSSSSSSLSQSTGSSTSHRGRRQQNGSASVDQDEVHRRVVIFSSTKRTCDWLTRELSHNNIRAAAVHGDKSQAERDAVLSAFRRGLVPVLVATDVAARGLDIPGVSSVVNYEFPEDHEMYIHRIGRTGRAGRKGESLTFLTPENANVTPVLVDIMKGANQHVPEELEAVAARVRKPAQSLHMYGSSRGGGGGGGRWGRGRGRGVWE